MPGTFTQVELPEGQQEPSGQVSALSGQTQTGGGPSALLAQTFPRGQQIGEVDSEQCPIVTSPLLHIGPRPQ